MLDSKAICEQIQKIYPDVGECGLDIKVTRDTGQKRWVVHLEKGPRKLDTYLEEGDAEKCMAGKQCVSLAIEINQLKDSIQRLDRG